MPDPVKDEKPVVKAEKKDPVYVVCRVTPGGLVTVVPAVSAKTQIAAMDATFELLSKESTGELTDGQNEVTLAAFLAGSLRAKKYRARVQVVAESEEVDIFAPVAPLAAVPEHPADAD